MSDTAPLISPSSSINIHGITYHITQSIVRGRESRIPKWIRVGAFTCILPILYVVCAPLMIILYCWTCLRKRIIAELLPHVMLQMDRSLKNVKLQLFQDLKGRRILDIGAGAGQYLQYFTEAAHVTELEPNPCLRQTIERAKHKFQTQHTHVQVDVVTGYVSDLLSRSPRPQYDVIVFGNVCCEIPNIQQVLHQCNQLLVPGGRVIFIEHIRSYEWKHAYFQDMIAPLWRIISDGCVCNKQTKNEFMSMQSHGWDVHTWDLMIYGASLHIQPCVVGVCIKRNSDQH